MTLEQMINKKERKKSKWQIYLKGCIPQQPKDRGMGEKVTQCGVEYRNLKEKDPKKLDQIIETISRQQNAVTKESKLKEAKK